MAWLTGSNQLLLEGVRESLAGRVSHATLHTLSVHELTRAGVVEADGVAGMLLRGGWPELYVDPALDATVYMDTGLAARLQGWRALDPLIVSPQAGPLFETLVYGEIVRARAHGGLSFELHLWRTRDGEEVDFVLTSGDRVLALDAKLAVQGVRAAPVPRGLARVLPDLDRLVLTTLGGTRRMLSRGCEQVPVAELHDLSVETFG